MVLLSHWSGLPWAYPPSDWLSMHETVSDPAQSLVVPQWASPPNNQLSVSKRKWVIQPVVIRVMVVRWREKWWILACSPKPPACSALGWGNRWGCVLWGSRVLANTAHRSGPGLPSGGSGPLPIPASVPWWQRPPAWAAACRTWLHRVGSLRRLQASWGLGAWLHQRWPLGRVWGPGPVGATSWNLPPLSQDLGLRGAQLWPEPWDLALSCQNREYHLFGGHL